VAEPYENQLSASGGPGLSGASPEAFGAAVGRGLEQAGESADRFIHQRREIDRDRQAAAAGVELATISTDLDTAAIDARNHAGPGGEGHSEAIGKAIDDRAGEALAKIKDPHIRDAFAGRYANLRDQIYTREYAWEAGARTEKFVTDFDNAGTQYANAQASNPNVSSLAAAIGDIETAGNALAVPADAKAKAIKEQQRKVVVAWANGMQDKDPRALIQVLDKGNLNPYFEPEDIKVLRSGADVEIRRDEAEARQQLAIQTADARERIGLIGKRIAAGDFSVSDQEFAAAADDAKKYDLKGPGFDLADWRDKRDVARETRTFTPSQWEQSINALEAKGDKRSPSENIRLKHLQELRGPSESRFNNDPFGAAAAAGNPAPAIDWSNPTPDQIQHRAAWARSWASSSGMVNPPYLSADEIKVFQDRVKQGTAGALEIASSLRGMAGVGLGVAIAKQIDPANKDLQLMIGLPPRTAELYKEGTAALERNPKLLGVDKDDTAALQSAFTEYAQGLPQDPDLQTAVWKAARAITAAAGAEGGRGELTGDELVKTFRNAVHRAVGQVGGGNGRTGGFVNWNGRHAWLPQSLGIYDFQHKLSRAGPKNWEAAGAGRPYFMGGDGKLAPLTDAQLSLLGRYQLETVSPGVYEPIGPGGAHFVDAKGRPWSFDVRKLP
jgi:hypothetical protein